MLKCIYKNSVLFLSKICYCSMVMHLKGQADLKSLSMIGAFKDFFLKGATHKITLKLQSYNVLQFGSWLKVFLRNLSKLVTCFLYYMLKLHDIFLKNVSGVGLYLKVKRLQRDNRKWVRREMGHDMQQRSLTRADVEDVQLMDDALTLQPPVLLTCMN